MSRLVRDKIVAQIEREGGSPVYTQVEGVEYAVALMAKFRKECGEFEQAIATKQDRDFILEEMADIITVLCALSRNVFSANIATVVEYKNDKCGLFDKGYILEKV